MRNSGSDQHSSHQKTKTVTCYICDKTVKEHRLSSHLFFGSLECRECHLKFRYCSKYSEFRKSRNSEGNESCLHRKLRYTRDPVDYLERKLRKELIKSKSKVQEPSTREVIKEMTLYLSVLRPLEYKSPWKYAIEKLKRYISRKSESKGYEKSANKINSNITSGKDRNEKHTRKDDVFQNRSLSNIRENEESDVSDEKSNINEGSGEVGIPQHVEEIVISQAEWNIDNISVKEFEESNKSVTISLSTGEDTDISLIVEAVNITKNVEEEFVSLIVEDALYSSGPPAIVVDSEVQMEGIQDELSNGIVEDKSHLLEIDEDSRAEAEDKAEPKLGTGEEMADLCVDAQENRVSPSAETNENLENNAHKIKSEEELQQYSKKTVTQSSEGEEEPAVMAEKDDDAEYTEKVCINMEEDIAETNNNDTKQKTEEFIPNLSLEYEENTIKKSLKEKTLGYVSVIGNENTQSKPLESLKERCIQYGKDDFSDKQNSSHSKRILKSYLEHQKLDRKSYRVRDGSCRSLRETVRRGKRKPYRRRDRAQGNAIKIKKYNLRSRRHKPSEAFLQRLDAYEKKKLWEKLTPIARMLRKLTAEGNLGCLPTLYLPIDSVEADDDFLVDVLLSQVFDIQQLRKMLMYVPAKGNDNEIADIVDQVRKAIEQFSKTGDTPNISSTVDILKPVISQYEKKCIRKDRVKERTESITKSLDRIIFGKNSLKRPSKTYYIDPPSDGNYYVVYYPSQPFIRECPLCYFRVFPAMFSLNLVTNLAVTKCIGCELIIYVVQESSDMYFLPKIIFKGEDVSENDSSLPMPARYKGLGNLRQQKNDSSLKYV